MSRNARLRDPRLWIALQCLLVVFLVSRQYVLTGLNVQLSDLPQYVEYSRDYAAAAAAGRPFFEFHREAVQQRLEQGDLDLPPSAVEWRSQIEYPPLALSWIVFATGLGPSLTGGTAGRDEVLQGSYRWIMASVDLFTFVMLAAVVMILLPDEAPSKITLRLSMYVLYGLLLGHLVYDRLDLLVGSILLLSLTLLVSRTHYAWSFVVLAVGINLKIVPAVLAPLWVVASLPASSLMGPWNLERASRLLGQVVGRSFLLVVLIGLILGACAAVYGPAAIGFLKYQVERRLEMGSLYTSGVLLLRELGVSAQTVFEFGSYSVRSPAADLLAKASPFLTIALLGLAYVAFLRSIAQCRGCFREVGKNSLAHILPFSIIEDSVLLLMLLVVASKVFSPQYLLWFVPVLPLMRIDGRTTWVVWALFGLVCAMTTVIWPLRFHTDIAGTVAFTDIGILSSGPTSVGVLLLVARNAMFGAATVLMFLRVTRAEGARGD